MKTNFAQTKCGIILLVMMTVIPGLATAASRATAAADRDPRSASSGSAVVKANAFLTVDGDHVRVAEDGSIVYDRDAEGSFTVTARSGWLVEGREMLTLPNSAERPRALKVTGLTGEDGAEVPVEPDDEEEPEEEKDYTLSIECDRYLGLDRTDSGRLGHTVKTATATLDPSCDGATVAWISCGSLCEFVEGDRVVTNPTGWTVNYRNKDPDTPSAEVDAEELVAEVTIPGKDGPIRASKRFTVVKVDVKVGEVGEDKEETDGAVVRFVPDGGRTGKAITGEAMNKLVGVKISCIPDLPDSEMVTVTCSGNAELYESISGGRLSRILRRDYRAKEFSSRTFLLHGHRVSIQLRGGLIEVSHSSSGAKDRTLNTVFQCSFDAFIDVPGDLADGLGATYVTVEKYDEVSGQQKRERDYGHAFWMFRLNPESLFPTDSNVSPVIQKSFLNKPVGFYPEDGHLQITALSGVPGRLVYPDIDHLRLPDDGRVDYLKADCDFIRNFDVSFDQLVDGLKYCNKLNEECLMSKIEYDADDHNCVSVMLEMANACGVLTEEETNRLNASFWAPGKLAAEWMK